MNEITEKIKVILAELVEDDNAKQLLEFTWFYPQILILPVSVITNFEKMPKI